MSSFIFSLFYNFSYTNHGSSFEFVDRFRATLSFVFNELLSSSIQYKIHTVIHKRSGQLAKKIKA